MIDAANKNKHKKEQQDTVIAFCEEDLLPEEIRKVREKLLTGGDKENPFT